eukprot:TRINITY_DN7599_c0_g1_i1.p1 TRINITY_DN7599_c0_g1~~TRINITY_DN7599_c0_g1_i1.p1  ORF type:complete len:585 (+),score=92.45 TRINITY_DN7599_c0_g1_i1:60-1814(+)
MDPASLHEVFEDFAENGSLSLHTVGADGTILWANREELNNLGYSREEYIGKHIAKFHCDPDVISDILCKLAGFETLRNYPARMKHADGSVVYVEINSSVHRDEEGRFQHTRCFTSNVTSRVLMDAQREMQRVNNERMREREIMKMLQHQAEHLNRQSLRLENEKRLRQSLLDRMLPPRVSSELLQGDGVIPQFYPQVAIFFSDIVGFTNIASSVPPHAVLALLNELYTVMDLCASTAGIYKVETIGDAFMGVAGLQDEQGNHCAAIAYFSLLVKDAIKVVKNPLAPDDPIQIRIGIHSGPVVAGIVGNLMPRFCLFGDTVNVASRMESTGAADRIHCSDPVAKDLAKAGYKLLPRGEVEVKGKGAMKTWWLDPVAQTSKPGPKLDVIIRAIQAKAKASSARRPLDQSYRLEQVWQLRPERCLDSQAHEWSPEELHTEATPFSSVSEDGLSLNVPEEDTAEFLLFDDEAWASRVKFEDVSRPGTFTRFITQATTASPQTEEGQNEGLSESEWALSEVYFHAGSTPQVDMTSPAHSCDSGQNSECCLPSFLGEEEFTKECHDHDLPRILGRHAADSHAAGSSTEKS